MQLKKINQDHYVVVNENWRITHSTQPLDQVNQPQGETSLGMFMMGKSKVQHLDLSYIKSLVGEVDVEKKAKDIFPPKNSHLDRLDEVDGNAYYRSIWKDGYNQCLEDNKDKRFSEEDLMKFYKYVKTHTVTEALAFITQPKDTWEVEFDENNNLKLK